MANPQPEKTAIADVTQQSELHLQTETIQLEYLQFPPGEGSFHSKTEHALFVNLSPRPIHYLQTQDGKTHTGFYRQGDFTLTPADVHFFGRWQATESCLQIRFSDPFLRSVAEQMGSGNWSHLSLVPTFQSRNPQIAAIATMMLTELQQNQPGGALYLDSLANVLAVQLLQGYGSKQPQLVQYDGGLPPHQLRRVLDYIEAHLAGEIKLADLAQLLSLSPFHFGRLFKQAIGLSPHQYVIQQRVDRAKRLLKQTDQAIIDIALDCGFKSHSHLSKQFRQLTGITPRAYRAE